MANEDETVLVVDDDITTVDVIRDTLQARGYHVLTALDGPAALNTVDKENPDLVLLDIMMPEMDGFSVCQRIREFSQVPIIMVTAKGGDEEKAKGLDTGADDYVTKPFSSKELTARVRAALRRPTLARERFSPVIKCYDLCIDPARRRVTVGDIELNITTIEYRLLMVLARNSGQVITIDEILSAVWGKDCIGQDHLVQVNVARLRTKLKETGTEYRHILTEHGKGYLMIKEP